MTSRHGHGAGQRFNREHPWLIGIIVGALSLRCETTTSSPENSWKRSRQAIEGQSGVSTAAAGSSDAAGGATSDAEWPELVVAGNASSNSSAVAGSPNAVIEPFVVRETTSFVRISEAKIDPPSTDGNFEFVELRGDPRSSLDAHWLVTIEGDSDSNLGQVDTVMDLSDCGEAACQFDDQGLLLLLADPQSTIPAEGAAWRTSSELVKGGLENGTTSLVLLEGAVAPKSGQDWDTNDDGTLELPPGYLVKDSVCWTDGDAGDAAYVAHDSDVLGPKPKVQAIYECPGDAGVRTWRFGQILGDSPSLVMDATHSVPAGLDSLVLTPGADNHCEVPTIVTLPSASSSTGAGMAGETSTTVATAGCGGTGSAGSGRAIGGNLATPSLAQNGGSGPEAPPLTSPPTVTVLAGRGSASSPSIDAAGILGHGGSPGAATVVAGCGSLPPLHVTAAVSQSGNSGWWTPNPYGASAAGNPSRQLTSRVSTSVVGGASASPDGSPQMPDGCYMASRPTTGFGVAWPMALATTFWRRRRSRRQKTRSDTTLRFA